MNKTKRRIFNSAMKLFAQNGYHATTVEEITSFTGVAKGTLYYHFKSKEEIYNFLVEERVNLLINSVQIKTKKYEKYEDKIKAVLLIQAKIIVSYTDLIKILLSDYWGDGTFNKKCKDEVARYIIVIENLVNDAKQKGEIKCANTAFLASLIYGLICSGIIYYENNHTDVLDLYRQFENIIFNNQYVLEEK